MVFAVLLLRSFGAEATRGLPNPFFAMDTALRDLSLLDSVKELGYAGVGWKTGEPAEVASSADQVRQRGLKLFAVYSYAPPILRTNGLHWDPRFEAWMAALKDRDTVLWLPINSPDYAKSSPDGDAVAVEGLRRLADAAGSNGVRVALYPHTSFWLERVQDAVRLAKKVDRKDLGVTFNLCHCLMVGDESNISEFLAEAAPHLFLVTINGADRGAAHTSWDRLIRPLDDGSFDLVPLLKRLRALNYTGPIGLQGYGVKLAPKENLTRSIAAWQRLCTAAARLSSPEGQATSKQPE